MTTSTRDERATADTFEVRSPSTGDLVGSFPTHTADDVAATVARARVAADWWAGLTFGERAKRLDRFRGIIARRLAQLAGIMHEETGKPHSDAALEASLALDHCAWAAKHADQVLGRRRAGVGLLTLNQAASVEYRPLGVVGVIGPWNYPVFTPLGSIVYALAAGNAVVFKPSEFTPGTGSWLVEAFAQVVPEHPVFQLITGDGSTGAALCASGVDKVAFTGSTATAKKVMAGCSETLTPIVAECGGKDALLVDTDADLDSAADAAAWAGMANAGQSCIGTERVYVHADVYDAFVEKLVKIAREQRAGTDPDAKIGPITLPSQVETIRRHINDALRRGGRAALGGPDAVDGNVVQPCILTNVPEDSPAVTEETFGPTLTVTKVRDMDDAVARANATTYGLGAAVFSKKRGAEIADRLRCGMVAVNAVFNFPQIPSLPFGGVGDSGFGRIHGPDGLREFSYARSVARQRFTPPLALTTFARTAKTDSLVAKIMTLLHGRH
ncbi:aldehyde dehydrogenase family protein [Saccharopolyspora karakumensis]|uniref:Aldehyde dehydrogenase n=1 Tax=Saccharopolyspora karakumensis TaxID=2530386 RepID=A0A4R5BWQ9_9PSEU|nr:aldehyde dehydrogenase family protein [Saccharopolyspora karakumensis]TDD90609.1 aldehyde dehydrogenase family protein [Saccharopolyspora karakumensis]